MRLTLYTVFARLGPLYLRHLRTSLPGTYWNPRRSQVKASDYFKSKTTDQLMVSFRPFVEKTMNENGVTQQYESLTGELKSLPFVKNEDLDINKYVVTKALDGLSYMLAEEERKIRKNPAACTTDRL